MFKMKSAFILTVIDMMPVLSAKTFLIQMTSTAEKFLEINLIARQYVNSFIAEIIIKVDRSSLHASQELEEGKRKVSYLKICIYLLML